MNSAKNTIHISKPTIFSFSECLHFLDRGYDDCLYSIEGKQVRKPLFIEGKRGLFQIEEVGDSLVVNLLIGNPSPDYLAKITRYVTQWFDLERDLQPFYKLLRKYDQYSGMPDRFFGLRLMRIPNIFEALCWCVIGQQINLTFAYRLKRKLVERYGSSIIYDSNQYYYFPEPWVLAELEVNDLKKLQFSRQKAEYIIGIAQGVANGEITKDNLSTCNNSKAMLEKLKEIRGVGDWTANYVLMKSLAQMDCITYGDTGLQSAVSSILNLERKPTRKEIKTLFEPFSGWESYMNIYLWRTLS